MRPTRTVSLLYEAAIFVNLMLGSVSCMPQEQGYWTKPNVSQALANDQFPNDSQQCDALVAQIDAGASEDYRARFFTHCMQARGYQWIVDQPRLHAVQTSGVASPEIPLCYTERRILDEFGYYKCVPAGTKDGGSTREMNSSPPQAVTPSQLPATSPPEPTKQTDQRWITDDGACRKYAKESLSSSYGIYAQCMQGKGWPLGS